MVRAIVAAVLLVGRLGQLNAQEATMSSGAQAKAEAEQVMEHLVSLAASLLESGVSSTP